MSQDSSQPPPATDKGGPERREDPITDETHAPAQPAGRGTEGEAWRVLAVPLASLLAIAIYILLTQGTPPPPPPPTGEYVSVRVLLVKNAPSLRLDLAGEWRVLARDGEAQSLELHDVGEVVLNGQAWALEGEGTLVPLPDCAEISLEPAQVPAGPAPIFGLEGRRYRGRLWVRRGAGGQVRVINAVGLEDYLAGVIGHEMPLRWHDEAVKAQAIAARTYALRELKPGREYDLERDTRSQVYKGVMGDDERAQSMVRATQGLVVKHEGRMVTTYFHSTCGGDTVPASWIFPWVKEDIQPLTGASDCTCQPSKYYRWEKTVDFSQIGQVTVPLPLKALKVVHWPRGQYVRELVLVGQDGSEQRWHGYRQARSYLRLRAPAFDAELLAGGTQATFRGRGWGHGVGMCQFGASGFAEQGLSAEQIMTHFYPGAEVLPITAKDLE